MYLLFLYISQIPSFVRHNIDNNLTLEIIEITKKKEIHKLTEITRKKKKPKSQFNHEQFINYIPINLIPNKKQKLQNKTIFLKLEKKNPRKLIYGLFYL